MANPSDFMSPLARLLIQRPLPPQLPRSSIPRSLLKAKRGPPSLLISHNRIIKTLSQAATGDITNGRELPEPEAIGLADGRKLQAAIIYNDLRGFSNLILTTPKKQTLLLLDTFVSEMARIASEFNGEVVDCAGDRIMAVFCRPHNDRSRQLIHDAVCCAFWMQTVVNRVLNPILTQRGLPTVSCGIGIDYGQVIVARVGIRNKNKLVFLGNAANMAAKLEEAATDAQTVMSAIVYDNRPEFMTSTNKWFFNVMPSWGNPVYYTSNAVFAADEPYRG